MRLATRSPFHLEATVRVLQRRPSNAVDVWTEGRYRRVLASGSDLALVEVTNRGTVDAPDVRLSFPIGPIPARARAALAVTVRTMLGLDVDPGPFQRRVEVEPALRPVALALRGLRPPRFPELFETFANVIPFQQLSLDAGVAAVSRLVRQFGRRIELDGRILHAFPTADVIAESRLASLRGCGISRQKAATLRHVARAIESGSLTEAGLEAMSAQDAERVLTDFPGIGPWSAALVLLRGLGRTDVFPPGDVGAQRGLMSLMHLRSKASLDRTVQRFGDCRGQFYFLGLGGDLLARRLIQPTGHAMTATIASYESR